MDKNFEGYYSIHYIQDGAVMSFVNSPSLVLVPLFFYLRKISLVVNFDLTQSLEASECRLRIQIEVCLTQSPCSYPLGIFCHIDYLMLAISFYHTLSLHAIFHCYKHCKNFRAMRVGGFFLLCSLLYPLCLEHLALSNTCLLLNALFYKLLRTKYLPLLKTVSVG